MLSFWNPPPIHPLRRAIKKWLDRHPWLFGFGIAVSTAIGITLLEQVFDRIVPTVNDGFDVYWPFNGIVIAILLMSRRRFWPWIVAGFAIAFIRIQILAQESTSEIATIILCNSFQILVAAVILPPFRSLKQWLLEPRPVVRFTLCGVLLGPLLTSFVFGYYYERGFTVAFWHTTLWWGFSDALGTALWMPFVLVLFSRETYDLFRWRALPETLALLFALCAVCGAVFSQNIYHVSFIPYPLLLVVALRLGFSGAIVGVNLLTLIVAWCSLHHVGPFRAESNHWDTEHIVVLQVFCILAALFVFPLSVTMVGRRDFEERLQQAYAGMKQLASLDPLTGVANRRQFDQALDHEWRRAVRTATPVGLLMIDADCFKAFNDHYGHVAGDECLRRIAAILSADSIRRHDLLARYGGEEFVVLLADSTPEHLEAVGKSLCVSVAAAAIPHERNRHKVVTISVGCASLIPHLQAPPEELIEAADHALYEAKQTGRNRVCCHYETFAV